MKKYIVVIVMLCVNTFSTIAQESKYYKAMQKAVATLDTTAQESTYLSLKNTFERIALAEKKEWLPYYYVAYCAMRLTYREKDITKLDMKADIAQAFLEKADSLNPKNSEIYCVKAMILYSRIGVDVMSRGPKYSVMGDQIVEESIALDSKNPRPYLLIADGKFSLPQQFGGDKKLGCQMFAKADNLFINNPPKDDNSPRWGRKTLDRMLKKCEEFSPTVKAKTQP